MLTAHFLSVDAKSFARPAASPTKNEASLSESDARKMLEMFTAVPILLTYLNIVYCKDTFKVVPHPWHRLPKAIFSRRSE